MGNGTEYISTHVTGCVIEQTSSSQASLNCFPLYSRSLKSGKSSSEGGKGTTLSESEPEQRFGNSVWELLSLW